MAGLENKWSESTRYYDDLVLSSNPKTTRTDTEMSRLKRRAAVVLRFLTGNKWIGVLVVPVPEGTVIYYYGESIGHTHIIEVEN